MSRRLDGPSDSRRQRIVADESGARADMLTIGISRRTLALVVAIVSVIWVAAHLADVMIVLFSAILLATAIHRPVSWLNRRGVPRPAGVLSIYLLMLGLLAGLVLLFVPLVNAEIQTLQADLPGYAERIERLVQDVSPSDSQSSHITVSRLFSELSNHLDTLVTDLTQLSLAAGHAVVLLLVTLAAAYYLAVAPEVWKQAAQRFLPERYQDRITAAGRAVQEQIGNWVIGQAAVALTFGAGMGIGLWLIGVPHALSLGLVAGILELIPYVGGIVTLALALPLAFGVGITHVIAVVALYTALVAVEAHVLTPYFLGRALKLPPVVVLIALVAGAELEGIVGLLLAIPVTAVASAIINECWPAPGATNGNDTQATSDTPRPS